MNLSGILVVVPVDRMERVIEELDALPGVEVHHRDPATGRIVVVQEAESVLKEVEGLKRIKNLPDVILAELVRHHFEEDPEILDSLPDDLEEGLPDVPRFLDDTGPARNPEKP